MLKKLLHWAIFIAVVLHLSSCLFFGQSYMPEVASLDHHRRARGNFVFLVPQRT